MKFATQISPLPQTMFRKDVQIDENGLHDSFGDYFNEKINNLVSNVSVDDSVYNGIRRVRAVEKNFMREEDVLECVLDLKIKNTEGMDRIPQRVLVDGISVLLRPLTGLFERIYKQKEIPDQWRIAKTVPLNGVLH